jgi:hypothetical protein
MHGVCDNSTVGVLFLVGMRGWCSTGGAAFDITTLKCEGAKMPGEAALLAANCSGAEHDHSWTFPLAVSPLSRGCRYWSETMQCHETRRCVGVRWTLAASVGPPELPSLPIYLCYVY